MSVYQPQGKPLSQQALYQQKLKQGIYNSPNKPSIGVASSASDTAALLAASTDLSVKPSYERLRAAPEAHDAANAVRLERSKESTAAETPNTELGIPLSYDHGSAYRQAHSNSISTMTLRTTPVKSVSKHGLTSKPSTASTLNAELGIPLSYDQGSVYKQAHTNSTSTMTLRTTPVKSVSKHGLTSKPSTASTLNIGKISQVADKNSSQLLNKRFNPGQDHRSGIKSAEVVTEDEGSLAAQSAGRALTMKHGSNYTDSISTQKRTKTFQAADVVDATLLAAASAKAKERLSSINAIHHLDLRQQAQLYSKALTAAQKNSEERLKAHNAGMIDLGGGLSLPISEVDKLANLIVQPVLDDIDSKATAQRDFDQAKQTKETELKSLHLKAKKEEENRKHSEKVQRLKEKDQRVQANEEKKKAEEEKFAEYQKEHNTEVDTKTQELRDLQAKYVEEKEQLLKEKKDNEERITEEESSLINGRKEELDAMQKEKDEILKPTLEELKIETEKLKNLTDTKDQLTSEVQSGESLKAEYDAKIKELKEKLDLINNKIESTTQEHDDYIVKREATDKEVSELQELTDKTLKEAEDTHKDLDRDLEALGITKKDNLNTKASHKKDIEQQIEEKVRGEHEINKQLPTHMQATVDEDRLRDTGSLFSFDEKKAAKNEMKQEEPKVTEKKPEKKEALVTPASKHTAKTKKVEELPTKKGGFRARLKNAFLTLSTTKPETKTSTKAAVTGSGKAAAAAASTAETNVEKNRVHKRDSFDTSNFEEDLSINKDGKKAGFFKEEI